MDETLQQMKAEIYVLDARMKNTILDIKRVAAG